MILVNDWISSIPFDLYQLRVFQLVATEKSFTKASKRAGLTQSAVTRQIISLEESLGFRLFDRTTRSVDLTPAGNAALVEAERLLDNASGSLRRLKEDHADARKEIRLGISRTVSLAHLPGLLHANLKRAPENSYRLSTASSRRLLDQIENNSLDIAVMGIPDRMAPSLRTIHQFDDAFVLIGSPTHLDSFESVGKSRVKLTRWIAEQEWMVAAEESFTSRRLMQWFDRRGWVIKPVMKVDGFDMLVHLVGLGLGVGFVPVRSLASYPRKASICRLKLPVRFVRKVGVITGANRAKVSHVAAFVENLLF